MSYKNQLYRVVTHNNHAHNLIYGDLMAHESFMIIGTRDVALNVCAMLNAALKESRTPVSSKKSAPRKISIPTVDEVADKCKFRPLNTPRHMIEQTIQYCATIFGVEPEKS